MDELLKLLQKNAALSTDQVAAMLDISEDEAIGKIKTAEADGSILGYGAILNEDKLDVDVVRALIEVRITPERDGGFDRVAERIAKYDEVRSCFLMSGGYDLLVVVQGEDLRRVAAFVSQKLASIDGVLSTATHFMLKTYKSRGFLVKREQTQDKLPVAP